MRQSLPVLTIGEQVALILQIVMPICAGTNNLSLCYSLCLSSDSIAYQRLLQATYISASTYDERQAIAPFLQELKSFANLRLNLKILPNMSTYTLRFLLRGTLFALMCSVCAQSPDLIDVSNLEQLDAIRYDLDGNGVADDPAGISFYGAAFGTPICPSGCKGYELTTDLDFEDASSYAAATRNDTWIDPSNGGTPSTEGWTPIGDETNFYDAIFDGNEYAISNLYVHRPSTEHVGLFGYVKDGMIRNLGLVGGSVTGNISVGGLVGRIINGSITSCYATSNAESTGTGFDSYAGGLVGRIINGSITSCYATGSTCSSSSSHYTGGLVGRIDDNSTIASCYATGNVSGEGRGTTSYVGGLVGESSGSITASYATGNAEIITSPYSNSTSYAGGLVGESNGSIADCYAIGDASSTSIPPLSSSYAGGLVGESNGSITSCYAIGDASSVSLSSSFSYSGGLVGRNSSGITACYATGDTSSTSIHSSTSYAGGLIGSIDDSGTVTSCYATGNALSIGNTRAPYVGGLVGRSSGGITACYAVGDASASASSDLFAGGLVGRSSGGITACYAVGDVSSSSLLNANAGGLVGRSSGSVTACYATGDVSATSTNTDTFLYVGGAVGMNDGGTVTASYYDSESTITGDMIDREGAQTKAALQAPTIGDGIYASWIELELDNGASRGIINQNQAGNAENDLVWDFGTSTEYPALRIDFDADSRAAEKASVAEFGAQRSVRFTRSIYNFVVGPAPGTTVGRMRGWIVGYGYTMSYRVVSQAVDGAIPITSGFAFAISNEVEDGTHVGKLIVAEGATLTVGQSYTLVVRVDDSNGGMDEIEAQIEVIDPVIPPVPRVLRAMTVSDTQIDLAWKAPTNTGGTDITSYQLQVSENEGTTWDDLYTTSDRTTLSYSHTGLLAGSTYHYRVAATNSIGRSAYSNTEVATTHRALPSAPINLMATAVNTRQIDLTWEAPTNTGGTDITSYQPQVSEDEGTTWTDLRTIMNATTLSYSHAGLARGSTHHYQVAAINGLGRGAYSETSSATTHDLPNAPTDLTTITVNDTQIDLAWEAPTNTGGTDITSYQLQVSENKGITWTDLHTTSDGTTLSYSHTSLSAGSTYHYRVAATNNVGRGAYSSVVDGATSNTAVFNAPVAEVGLRAYPNPTSGELRFVGLSYKRTYFYEVYSLMGEKVSSGTLDNKSMIDVSSFAHREYILMLKDEKGDNLLCTRLLVPK